MLGYPAGICQVVDRIDDNIKNEDLEKDLISKVEKAEDLDNQEALLVYPRILETPIENNKLYNLIELSSHAQYRMDLRGVTVGDIKVALKHFVKKFYNEKSQNTAQYIVWEKAIQRGTDMVFLDTRLGNLFLSFVILKGKVVIKTCYFKDENNPRPKTCRKKLAMLRFRLNNL